MQPFRVVIIGGGFCGAALATLLLRRSWQALDLVIVDPRGVSGGTAFETKSTQHVLNVPAQKMSLLPDAPDDFVRFAEHSQPAQGKLADAFVQRQLYGHYVNTRLEEALTERGTGRRVRVLKARAERIVKQPSTYQVRLDEGGELVADAVVLALGLPERRPSPNAISPYDDAALAQIAPDGAVAVLGAGLSALDAFLSLRERRHHGRITFVSRHGLWPLSHRLGRVDDTLAAWAADLANSPLSTRLLVRAVRQRAAVPGTDWRDVMDALRPHTNGIWQRLSVRDRQAFLRHVQPYFAVHRHRVAPEVFRHLSEARSSGQLSILAGRLQRIRSSFAGQVLTIRRAHDGATAVLCSDAVIDARGPDFDALPTLQPLVGELLRQGLALRAEVGGGLLAGPDGRLHNEHGTLEPGLFAAGSLLRGTLWETTAVPELRAQCATIVDGFVAMAAAGKHASRLRNQSDVG